MIYICSTLDEFNEKATIIHNWKKNNVVNYNADQWQETIKHVSEDKWALFLPENYVELFGELETIDELPKEWYLEED